MKCLRRLAEHQAPDCVSFWSVYHAQGLVEHHLYHITLGTTHCLDRAELISVRRCLEQFCEEQ